MDLGFKCVDPYVAGRMAFPCGRCIPCRNNRRKLWTHRIMLEAAQHEENGFVTLTYAEECVPAGGSLRPEDLREWWKRLRQRIYPTRVRYFAVGEYGDKTARPHYHAAIFGIGCRRVPVNSKGECECGTCLGVRKTWRFGHTYVGSLEGRSAAYIAGYVTKKLQERSLEVTDGLVAPFCRMSLRPGIGADAVPDIASVLMTYGLEEKNLGDVPSSLMQGKARMPLGRYIRQKLRASCGLPINAPEQYVEALRQGLLPVWEVADAVCAHPTMARFKSSVVSELISQNNTQGAFNMAAKQRIRNEKEQI